MKAINVISLEDYKIKVDFNDGVSGIIDLSDLVQKGIFKQLKNKQLFNTVYTDSTAICWSDELEIDAENIYAKIMNLDPSTLLNKTPQYAAD